MMVYVALIAAIFLLSYIFWHIRQHKILKIARAVAFLKRYEYAGAEELTDAEVDELNQQVTQDWKDPVKKAEMLRQASVYANKDAGFLMQIAAVSGYKQE
ncbi:hypothetical protein L3Q72_07450 [Vibrio sp. JC009]|uniref:hypothetical protein n=1 Tax=Vibrio sp. JC009 TaxID=2912314 RepID=UPI0023B07E10|nr:hypothetical protein [Vibrio sp. JC009]WED23217.1 hypothetical protein L3Q72_07450 [Vibrio sp. JC009]